MNDILTRLLKAAAQIKRGEYSPGQVAVIREAADCISELRQTAEHYRLSADDWYKAALDLKGRTPIWISVKDRTPDPFAVVLVSVATWNGYNEPRTIETLGTVAADNKLCLLYGRLADGETITHWMELPKAP